ncbi:hypothetical protein [Paenibacillus sp. 1P03SA]|uniref:hypothetical protein n=1 Tax=Paenibacillus sp. 1P03SA TaxID=3132294 RepID=UPI0039A24927
MTRKEFEQYLNELSMSDDEKKSNGGRIPDNCKYGSWLRRNDPVMFNVGFGHERSKEN